MDILLLGKNGQLGSELQKLLKPLGNIYAFSHQELGLENTKVLKETLYRLKPSIIVNAAAYTGVDKAEKEVEKAFLINAEAVHVIAEVAKKLNAWFVHYSTDYVFDGSKSEPYIETDLGNPLNTYGKSKLAGEKLITAVEGNYLIYRTSWVYAKKGHNFVNAILKLAQERDELSVVSDQYGSPTSATLIAQITAMTLYKIHYCFPLSIDYSGLYHLTAEGHTSWYKYARYIIKKANESGLNFKLKHDKIFPLSSKNYMENDRALRPKNSRLNTEKIKSIFNIVLPSWQTNLERLLKGMFESCYAKE